MLKAIAVLFLIATIAVGILTFFANMMSSSGEVKLSTIWPVVVLAIITIVLFFGIHQGW